MLKLLPVVLLSAAAFGGTIPVTGFGSFSLDNEFDTSANFCMFGSGISTCLNNVPIGPAAPVELSQLTSMDVSGVITITSDYEFQTRFVNGVLNINWWETGTFTITQSTPEPTNMGLVFAGLVVIWWLGNGKTQGIIPLTTAL
jgi:hypothetical protein